MEVILSTAFGVKGETQTVENDPITELAKKAMAAHPLVGIMCKELLLLFLYLYVFVLLLFFIFKSREWLKLQSQGFFLIFIIN